jgi:hypothetical protein
MRQSTKFIAMDANTTQDDSQLNPIQPCNNRNWSVELEFVKATNNSSSLPQLGHLAGQLESLPDALLQLRVGVDHARAVGTAPPPGIARGLERISPAHKSLAPLVIAVQLPPPVVRVAIAARVHGAARLPHLRTPRHHGRR